jgi:hypothetical protein
VDKSIDALTVIELKQEAEQVWRPYHVRLVWPESAPAVPIHGVTLEAILARRIDAGRSVANATVLGFTTIDASGGGGPIHVSLDATRDLLTRGTPRSEFPAYPNDIARALGRVLAHEIGHRLLGFPAHDRTGLMRPAFRPGELREPGRQHFTLTSIGISQLDRRLPRLRGDNWLTERASCHPG